MNELNERLLRLYNTYKHKISKMGCEWLSIYIWVDTKGITYNVGYENNTKEVFSSLDELENYISNFRSNEILYRKFSLEE